MPGSMNPAIVTTYFSLVGVSPSRGTIGLTTAPPTGGFADFGFIVGGTVPDPYVSRILSQVVDVSASTGWVRTSITATAPTGWTPSTTNPQDPSRAAYAGMVITDTNVMSLSASYIDHAQFEAAASTTLLPQAAEGYDTGMFYTVEPGVGSLWERSQARTLAGKWAGHFKATPGDAGNTYTKVSSFSSYNQILAANRTYNDLLIGPS